jgi:erythronate-4-phosphate dehydrogenase
VKEYVVAGLLALANAWGFTLRGKTIGVVGVGNVGSKVANAAAALGMSVLQNDPPLARRTGEKRFVPLDELMGCDVISVHTPLTLTGVDRTFHLFDEARMKKLRPSTIFFNTSRGAVVETQALLAALREHRVARSVIDVWEHEPAIDLDLLSEATLGTPHIAGYSLDGKLAAVGMVRDALCRYLAVSPKWDPVREMPSAGPAVITVRPGEKSAEEVLHRIVKDCYDIAFDDAQLRTLARIPAPERPASFRTLRSAYRTRREFTNYTVHLPAEHSYLGQILSALGFEFKILQP